MQKEISTSSLEAIPSDSLRCHITGNLRKATPEEKIRQEVARSLVDEYSYSKNDIGIEFKIVMGKARKRADIVVFQEGAIHNQENIYMILETKQESIKPSNKSAGLDQVASYAAASPNCKYALWAGSERLAFEVIKKRGKRILVEIPDIPRKGEITVPRPTRGDLVPAVNLKQVFQRIHNYIYANQGFQKDRAFEELQKIIFIKVFDEQYNPTLQFYRLQEENISKIRERLSDVFHRVTRKYDYIFSGDETIDLNDRVLGYVVSELQRFSLVDTDTDIKGEAYEAIVGPNLRGDRGEFFTPRNVCRMTVEMLFSLCSEEDLTNPGGIRILDPAVGTGGFLIAGIRNLKSIFAKRGFEFDKLRDLVRDVVEVNFFGIDFNPFLVKVAQMNMVMHGDGSSNIIHANSLEDPEKWDYARSEVEIGDFDIVITNPPFGTKALIDNQEILKKFELHTYGASSPRNSLPPEQLFIEQCWRFLKPGGLMGIVLPDSILTNPGLEWLRKWILERTWVIASIDLPVETFEPHTGTQTSVIILRKRKANEKASSEYDIFMAIPEKIGHDRRGNTIFRKTPEGKIALDQDGKPSIDDHLPIIVNHFRSWLKEKGMI